MTATSLLRNKKSETQPLIGAEEPETNTRHSARVLLVEDNPITRKVFRLGLQHGGYTVIEAGNGAEAVDAARSGPIDLVVLDMVLPDMNGLEIAELISKQCEPLPKFVAVTGLRTEQILPERSRSRFRAILEKPVDVERLVEAAAACLAATDRQEGKRTVLVVDDDPLQRKLLSLQLAASGFRVVMASSSAEGLAKAEESRPDATVLDIVMPESNGFDLCLALRASETLRATPLVMYSSCFPEHLGERFVRTFGADAFVSKSDGADALVEAIEKATASRLKRGPLGLAHGPNFVSSDMQNLGAEVTRMAARMKADAEQAALADEKLNVMTALIRGAVKWPSSAERWTETVESVLHATGNVIGGCLVSGNGETWQLASAIGMPVAEVRLLISTPEFARAKERSIDENDVEYVAAPASGELKTPISSGSHLVLVPIFAETRPTAVIFWLKDRLTTKGKDRAFAELLRVGLSESLTLAESLAQLRRNERNNSVLAEISRAISAAPAIDSVSKQWAVLLSQLIPYDHLSLCSIDADKKVIVVDFVVNPTPGWEAGSRRPVEGTVTEKVIRENTVVFHASTNESQLSYKYPGGSFFDTGRRVATISVPLVQEGRAFAALHLVSSGVQYGKQHVDMAMAVAAQIAGPYLNAELLRNSQREAREREALVAIGIAANSSMTTDEVGSVVAASLAKLVSFDRLDVVVSDSPTTFKYVFSEGDPVEGVEVGGTIEIGPEPPQLQFESDGAFLYGRLPEEVDRFVPGYRSSGFQSAIQVPLISQGKPIAWLALWRRDVDAYTSADLRFMRLIANQVAPAFAHSLMLAMLEEKVDQRTKSLTESNAAMARLLSVVAHELRTPLTSIVGFSELLQVRAGDLDEREKEWVTLVHRNGLQMAGLITDLLDLSRLESGRIEVNLQPIDVARFAQECIADLAPVLGTKRQTIHLVAQADARAMIDTSRMKQVMSNIIGNASKYSPHGSKIVVRVTEASGMAGISVQDEGLGISEQDQAKLFAPFFRSADSKIQEIPGTGLGLAISKGIVELHQGKLSVKSELGKGSCFTVHLHAAPLAEIDA